MGIARQLVRLTGDKQSADQDSTQSGIGESLGPESSFVLVQVNFDNTVPRWISNLRMSSFTSCSVLVRIPSMTATLSCTTSSSDLSWLQTLTLMVRCLKMNLKE